MKKAIILNMLWLLSFVGGLLSAEPGTLLKFDCGDSPWDLAVGDFNNDGHQDIVTANEEDSTITILLGRGDGWFPDSATSYFSGSFPRVVDIGDFNRDGNQDIVVANSGPTKAGASLVTTDELVYFFGDGTGYFELLLSNTVGDYPAGLALDDYNEDGITDIAVTNYRDQNVMILLGRENGSFRIAYTYIVGNGPRSLVPGDFNEDGHVDLAIGVRTAGFLRILEGDGTGMFTVVDSTYEMEQFPREVVTADFNMDGHLDIAGSCRGNSRVCVYLGTGTGYFNGPTYYNVGLYPRSLAAMDANGDGRVDIVSGNFESNDVTFLIGYGDGTFIRWTDQFVGLTTRSVVSGDFDEDGFNDLAVVNAGNDEVAVLFDTPEVIRPELISPGDSTITFVDPTFVWRAAPGSNYFQILVTDTLGTFSWSKIVHHDTTFHYDGIAPLAGGTPYNWKIKQASQGTFWSFVDPFIFLRVKRQSDIGTPVPKVPQDTGIQLPELFSWNGVDGGDRYGVTVHSDTTMTDTLWAGYTKSSHIVVPVFSDSLPFDSTLYWQVTAFDTSGNPGIPTDPVPFFPVSSAVAPVAPAAIAPTEPDTIFESPVQFTWSWPEGATAFTLSFSLDASFPVDPTRTWIIEDLTDSTALLDLPPAQQSVFWYVTASNSAGESSPSDTAAFEYSSVDSNLIQSVDITSPRSNMEYPFGSAISPRAILRSTFTGQAGGVWLLDGDPVSSFSVDVIDTIGVEVIGSSFRLTQAGEHTLQAVVTDPDSAVSDTARFSIAAEASGPANRLVVSVDPASLAADGNSTAQVNAFVVDESGEVLYNDSDRLIAFVVLGEAEFPDSSYAYTNEGEARVTLMSTTTPDSDILVFAYSEGLETGYAQMSTHEGDIGGDLVILQSFMDRLSNLDLEIYDPPYDLTVAPYDQALVQEFLDERIIGVGDPEELDKSGLRRILFFERALHHAYHHEYDLQFPDPKVETGPGGLSGGDDVSRAAWTSSLITGETVLSAAHLIPKTRREDALKSLVRKKAIDGSLGILEGLYYSVANELSHVPQNQRFVDALMQSLGNSFTLLDTIDNPRFSGRTPSLTSLVTREVVETMISDAQVRLDSAAVLAGAHTFDSSDTTAERLVRETIDVIDAVATMNHEDFEYYLLQANPDQALEDQSNVRALFDKSQISRDNYVSLKSAIESSCAPGRWRELRHMVETAVSSFTGTAYDFIPLSFEQAFGIADTGLAATLADPRSVREHAVNLRRRRISEQGGGEPVPVALWQNLLDTMASRALDYEETARSLMHAINERDTLLFKDLLPELILRDDSLSVALEAALATTGAVYPAASLNSAGFAEDYDVLRAHLMESQYHRLMFVLQSYDYALRFSRYVSGLMAVEYGSRAIDSTREFKNELIDFVTALFDETGFPLLVISDLHLPDSCYAHRTDTLSAEVTNLGAGTAHDVFVKVFIGPGLSLFRGDSISVGDLVSGGSARVDFRVKARRNDILTTVPLGVAAVSPHCSNGIGYPDLVSTMTLDVEDLAWEAGPLDKVPTDTLVNLGLLQPVGGELLAGGSEYEIMWVSYGTGIDHIAIFFSDDGGATFPDTIIDSTANSGTYPWSVPETSTDSARVRLVAFSSEGEQLADVVSVENFTIDATPPTVDVLFPDGGDTLYVGVDYTIEWVTTDSFPGPGLLRLRRPVKSRERNTVVSSRVPVAGRETVSRKAVGRRRSDTRGPSSTARNDRRRLTRGPASDLLIGEPYTVNIYYSTNSGQNWRIVAVGEPDDSSHVWTVPNAQSDSCRIAVDAIDGAGNHGSGMSESDFTITTAEVSALPGTVVDSRGRYGQGEVSRRSRNTDEYSKSAQQGSSRETPLLQSAPPPKNAILDQNVPNPFNPSTVIQFALPGAEPVHTSLVVYDLRGKQVVTLVGEILKPGWHTVVWDGRDARRLPIASGVYFYILRAGDEVLTRKMTLVR